MKKVIYLIMFMLSLPAMAMSTAERPDWVDAKPSSLIYYTGVGSAPANSPDREQIAKNIALNDIISEIGIKINSESLLDRQEVNGVYSEYYQNVILTQSSALLEGYELVDTYNDGTRYWVFYQLDKDLYAQLMEKRVADAIERAYEYWVKGNQNAVNGNIETAARLYAEGLSIVAPYSNRQLLRVIDANGTTIDIALTLYDSLLTVFGDIEIKSEPAGSISLEGEASQWDIKVSLSCAGVPVSGMKVGASLYGASRNCGTVMPINSTNQAGETTISLTDIPAKEAPTYIVISLESNLTNENPAINEIIATALKSMPSLNIPIVNNREPLKVYINSTGCRYDNLSTHLASYLNQRYVEVVTSKSDADIEAVITASFSDGGMVNVGTTRKFATNASCMIQFIDLNDGNTIKGSYNVSGVRALDRNPYSDEGCRKAAAQAFKELRGKLDRKGTGVSSIKFKRKPKPQPAPEQVDIPEVPVPPTTESSLSAGSKTTRRNNTEIY